MKELLRKFGCSLLIGFVFSFNSYSMPGPSAGSPPAGSPPAGGPPCWSPPCVPIDGGIGLLLAAGAFIGVRRIYKGSADKVDKQA